MSNSKIKREVFRRLGGAVVFTVMIGAWIITSGTSPSDDYYKTKVIENSGDFQIGVSDTADVWRCVPDFIMEHPVTTFEIFDEQDQVILEVDCNGHNNLVEIYPSWSGSSFNCEMVMNVVGDYDTDADTGTSEDSGTEKNDAGAITSTCTCSLSPAWDAGNTNLGGDAGVVSPREGCRDTFRAAARTTAGLWGEVIYSLEFIEAPRPLSCEAL